MSGFWTWAMQHEFLAFFAICSLFKTVRIIIKSIARVFWRPLPGEPRDEDLEETDSSDVGMTVGRALDTPDPSAPPQPQTPPATPPAQPPRAPARPRRSMWQRLMDD